MFINRGYIQIFLCHVNKIDLVVGFSSRALSRCSVCTTKRKKWNDCIGFGVLLSMESERCSRVPVLIMNCSANERTVGVEQGEAVFRNLSDRFASSPIVFVSVVV